MSFLDGIALSPEFRPEEALIASTAAGAAAVATVEATRANTPPGGGKISSGFMTVFLLVVVGVPTAFLLSKLYGGDEPETPSANAAHSEPAGEAPVEAGVAPETPVVGEPPASPIGESEGAGDPVVSNGGDATGNSSGATESDTLNPAPLPVLPALPVSPEEADADAPLSASYPDPAAGPGDAISADPVAVTPSADE